MARTLCPLSSTCPKCDSLIRLCFITRVSGKRLQISCGGRSQGSAGVCCVSLQHLFDCIDVGNEHAIAELGQQCRCSVVLYRVSLFSVK